MSDAKIILSIIFWLCLFGQFCYFNWDHIKDPDGVPAHIELAKIRHINNVGVSKMEAALEKQKKGIFYGPKEYFSDLIDIEKVIAWHYNGKMRIMVGIDGVSSLQNLMLQNVGKGFTHEDIEAEAKKHEKYLKYTAPFKNDLNEKQPVNWEGFFKRLRLLYAMNIVFAMLMFLLWAKEEIAEKRKWHFASPWRFAFLLLIYPLVFFFYAARWFKRGGREIYAEAEIRRRNRIFIYISPEQLEAVKEFARSNLSFRAWRDQFADAGLKPCHNLATALAVSMIFVFVIRPVSAGTKQIGQNFAATGVVLSQLKDCQNLARMSIEDENQIEKNQSHGQSDAGCDMFYGRSTLRPTRSVITLVHVREFFRRLIMAVDIWHIPRPAFQLEANQQFQSCLT